MANEDQAAEHQVHLEILNANEDQAAKKQVHVEMQVKVKQQSIKLI